MATNPCDGSLWILSDILEFLEKKLTRYSLEIKHIIKLPFQENTVFIFYAVY